MSESFHLYLDESGSRNPDHQQSPRADGLDHFAFGGLLLKSEDTLRVKELHATFMKRFELKHPLHSTEIRGRKANFAWLGRDSARATQFHEALDQLMMEIPGHVTGCVVHRPGYDARYRDRYGDERWRLCKSAYTIVVERAAKIARANGRKLLVYVEACGKREDREIAAYHKDMRKEGMYFDARTSAMYKPAGATLLEETLTSTPYFVKKSHPIMQMSDLVLYPIVKGRYDASYKPFQQLRNAGKLIDATLSHDERKEIGIKYYCFD